METSNFNKMMELYTEKIEKIIKEDPNADEILLHTNKLNSDSEFLAILDSFFASVVEKGKINESELEKLAINDIAYNCFFCYLNKRNIQINENAFIPEEYISNDSVKEYLKSLGDSSLLTPEEEIILAKQMELGNKARKNKVINHDLSNEEINKLAKQIAKVADIRKSYSSQDKKDLVKEKIYSTEDAKRILFTDQTLTNRKMEKLAKYIHEGDKASEEFINRNLRLVVSVAKRYLGKGLDFLDLIQEGNIGLCKATEKFDIKKGFKFSTYATWWIRQGMTRAIADQGKTIRIPVHMYESVNKLKRFENKYMCEHDGKEPTNIEIAEALDISISSVETIKTAMIYSEPISLETPIGPEEDSRLEEFIPDESDSVEDTALRGITAANVNTVLKTLSSREERVIRLRFGLNDEQRRYTLEEVGAEFKVTRERIRQIEAKAIRKLKHPQRKKMLGIGENNSDSKNSLYNGFYSK